MPRKPRIKAAFRREVEERLRRVARAGSVFLDGEDFKDVVKDPELGQVCADEPGRHDPQYHVDHAKFIGLKRTLFQLKRLEAGPCSVIAWRPFRQSRADLEREMGVLDWRIKDNTASITPANRSHMEARIREFRAMRERLQARLEGRLVEEVAKVVILMDIHPMPARPGTCPASPALTAAFAGGTAVREFELNGRPGLSVFAPIRDSLGDVVGAVEAYAPLVPEDRPGDFFGMPGTVVVGEEAPACEKEKTR